MKFGTTSISCILLTTCVLWPLSASAAAWPNSAMSLSSSAFANQLSKPSGKQLKVTSAQQAAQLVKRQYPGKILKVSQSRVRGNPAYKVKLLSSSGSVFYVVVDAKTGRISRN